MAPDPLVRIDPADSVMKAGEAITFAVTIEEAANLGAFEFTLLYTPSIVQATDVALGDFLGGSGRSVVPVGPVIDDQAGRVRFGAFSFGEDRGPDGAGILASITFEARGEGQTILDLEDVKVADIAGHPQTVTVEDGRVTVGRPPKATPKETATPEPTATATPKPTATPRPPIPTPVPLPPTSVLTAAPTPTPEAGLVPPPQPTEGPSATPEPTAAPEATLTPAPPSGPAEVPPTTIPAAKPAKATPGETKAPQPTTAALEAALRAEPQGEAPTPVPPQTLVWGFLAVVLLGAMVLLYRREAR